MKSALIVEDEKFSAERMQKLLSEHTDLEVMAQLHSVKSALDWLATSSTPDIIFLDIQLGDGTGFDILDRVQSFPHIIFTTAFDKYTLKAFKYNSIDYLLKPIKAEELISAIDKLNRVEESLGFESRLEDLKRDILKTYKDKFLIKTGLKYRSVTVNEVAFFFSAEGTTHLQTIEGDRMMMDLSLEEIETLIDPNLFFRVNRHILVKAESIESIDSYFNGRLLLKLLPTFEEQVIVSRAKVKAFKKWLGE